MNRSRFDGRHDPPQTVNRSGDGQSFGWDVADNRTAHTRAGSSASYTLAAGSHRLAAVSGAQWRNFGYDAVGHVASESRFDGSRGYGYDPFAAWPASPSTEPRRAATRATP